MYSSSFMLVCFIYSFCNSVPKLPLYALTEGLISILRSGIAIIDARVVVILKISEYTKADR